jgi:tetratricopeptide (TPR) repeat protein
MKNIIILSLLSISLYSCSSFESNTDGITSAELTSHELEQIENTDFLPAKEIKYQVRMDKFDFAEPMDLNTDSLVSESIARTSERKLKLISNDGAIEKDPITAIISLCYQKDYKEAELIMDNIYKKYRSHPSYWNQIGTCYFLRNNMRKALLYYNKSRSLSKKYAPPINNLGVIYQRQGLEQKALLAFKKASQLSSFSLTPVFNLAQIYLKYGFSRRARNLFLTLLKKSPNDVDALDGLATSYLQQNKLKIAIDTYAKIPDDKKRKAEIGLNLAVALKLSGKNKEAENTFAKISKNKLGNYGPYYNKIENFVRGEK